MKKRIYILSIISTLVFNSSFAQKAKTSNAIKKYENLSYVESRNQLLELANKEEASSEVIEKLANAFYFNNEMEEASKWYSKLLVLNPEANAETYFRYAHALKAQEKYDDAKDILKNFYVKKPEDTRAKAFLKSQDYLNEIEELSGNFDLINLDINTKFSDFGTSIYNGNLIFASSRDENENIYKWNDQPFLDLFELNNLDGTVKEIMGDINTKYHESSTAFTKDGKTVYFTRNNYFKGKFKKNSEDFHTLKIYKADLIEGEWTNVVSMPFNDDEYSVAHPTLSKDEKKLYFASDMPGTYGMSDIFVVDINEDGTYGNVKNLGRKINTEGRENFPFISEKGILYFSSDGHVGLGGLDVFKIEIDKIGGVNTIQNLGKPINSPKDDFGYIIDETSKKGYLSSNREGGKGDDDIYSFEVTECSKMISGTVINKKTQEVLNNANLFIYDSRQKLLQSLKSDDSGKFEFSLECKNRTYIIEAKKENYSDDFTDFSIKSDKNSELKLELQLEPKAARIGTDLAMLLDLNPIYFDYDKSYIRPDAEIELKKVINYMKEYPSVKVDVRSHTDSRGKDAYNLALSNRRNKSTKAYIIKEGGISSNRLTGKGYGETRLTNRCSNANKIKCTEDEHQANRRSEFIVIDN